jgi:Sulfatase
LEEVVTNVEIVKTDGLLITTGKKSLARQLLFWLRELVAVCFWAYVICKLFVFDIDIYLLYRIDPSLTYLAEYKFFFLIGFAALFYDDPTNSEPYSSSGGLCCKKWLEETLVTLTSNSRTRATRGAPTPRIDKLASEGMRLTNMNMEAQCTPSRSSILTGRYAIRSGTHSVPFGGVADGLTQWEVTMAESLSAAGYATALNGKWHLGSQDGRLPNDQGFDEWYGIPRTTDEALWPGSPGYSPDIMPPEQIMEGRKGEKSRVLKVYDLEQRRLIDAEITRRSIAFMERQTQAKKPFFAYATLTQPHLPTLPNPAFAGKTGNGDWADMLAELDQNVGQMLDAVDRLGIRDNTIVIFASDNGPEFIKPWDGWAGPWRGQYFTAWEGGIRVPFLIRWPGKVPAGRVSDEIVHGIDLFPTLHCRRRRAERSADRWRRSIELLHRQDRKVRPRRNFDLVRGPPPGGEVAQFQSAFLSTGDDGFAADQAGDTTSVQSLYEPA